MAQLFENRAEPWQRRATTRAESEISIEAEWEDPHNAVTRLAGTPAVRPSNDTAPTPARTSTAEDLDMIAARVAGGRESRDTVPVPTVKKKPADPQSNLKSIAELDPSASGAALALSITGDKSVRRGKVLESRPDDGRATNSSGEVIAVGVPRTATTGEVATLKGRARAPSKEQVKKTAHMRVSPDAPRSSWPLWLAVIAALLAVGAVVTVLLVMRDDGTASADSQQQPATLPSVDAAPAPEKKPDPPPPPQNEPRHQGSAKPSIGSAASGSGSGSAKPKAGMVRVRVTSTPTEATVLLDNKRLGHTPWEGEFPADAGKHQLKVRRKGYMVMLRDIRLDGDVNEEFTMVRAAPNPDDGSGSER
jgi:hypothetical protein